MPNPIATSQNAAAKTSQDTVVSPNATSAITGRCKAARPCVSRVAIASVRAGPIQRRRPRAEDEAHCSYAEHAEHDYDGQHGGADHKRGAGRSANPVDLREEWNEGKEEEQQAHDIEDALRNRRSRSLRPGGSPLSVKVDDPTHFAGSARKDAVEELADQQRTKREAERGTAFRREQQLPPKRADHHAGK